MVIHRLLTDATLVFVAVAFSCLSCTADDTEASATVQSSPVNANPVQANNKLSLQPVATKRMLMVDEKLPIGFKYADSDSDGFISRSELRKYLKPRLKGMQLPYSKIFKELDGDSDGKLTEIEFEPRNQIIEKFVEQLYPAVDIADDPGIGYKLFKKVDQPIDDALVYSAVYHRTMEATQNALTTKVDLEKIPRRFIGPYPAESELSLEGVIRATVVLGGGKGDEDFFTAGGIIVSPDGLLLTNWHVAESINDGLVALTF
ncbi:MAG: hypothetical protein U0930_15760 [Pirellulales bacterium]